MFKILYIYIFVFVVFCLFTYLFIDANFFYLKILYSGFATDQRLIVSALLLIFIISLYLLYLKILNFKNFTNFINFKNYKFLFLIPIAGILAYPAVLSFDLFNYIATAKVAFHYFENPYVIMPIELINEPILIFTRATNKIALYGPLWTFMSGLPYYLSFENYLLAIVLFKTFISFFYAGIVWFIWKLTKSVSSSIFFAASPLVLIETFVSGHNDVVMMFAALGSMYFLKNKKVGIAILLLILSVLIKYATVFLIPAFCYVLYKQIKHKEIDWDFVYLLCFVSMLFIFFLSPIREEIYPWYAIWPLTFLSLIANKHKMLTAIFVFFTFCLMLRYIPYMLLGTYFGTTPYVKILVTFFLPGIYLAYLLLRGRLRSNK